MSPNLIQPPGSKSTQLSPLIWGRVSHRSTIFEFMRNANNHAGVYEPGDQRRWNEPSAKRNGNGNTESRCEALLVLAGYEDFLLAVTNDRAEGKLS